MSLRGGWGWDWIAAVLGVFVHNLDPVILPLGPLALRWYGLAYLAGFVAGFFLLRHLARRGLWVLKPEMTGDFIAAAALLGVFVGGRLGYALFYSPDLLTSFSKTPPFWDLLAVWKGGMASHGGILGLVVLTWFYSRKHKVSWTGLGDGLCVVAPVGLFCGRMANFINGELYGRVAQGVSWAMKFPTALGDGRAPESERLAEAARAATAADPALSPAFAAYDTAALNHQMGHVNSGIEVAHQQMVGELLAANRANPEVTRALEPFLEPRHPSQLYEAALEGAALFAILWWVRTRFPKAPHGTLTGLFFGFYAVFRIFAEQFREPDAAWVVEGMLTKGQFFSLFMFIFAGAFLFHAWRGRNRVTV